MRPALRPSTTAEAAFTLLEICLAIFIGVIIMLAAVPSIKGLIEEQHAKKLFNEFDALTKEASSRAVTERQPYVIEWDESGVTMHPAGAGESAQAREMDQDESADQTVDDGQSGADGQTAAQAQPGNEGGETKRVDFGEKLAPELILPAALTKNPPAIWTFWPTGTCEPATVICHVPGAAWTATYDPLTEQAAFTSP